MARPFIIEPQKERNKNYEFYKQNEVDLPKDFNPYGKKS